MTIRAAGLILAKHVEGELYLLLQYRKRRGCFVYEDFGGKVDRSDVSPIDTLLREAVEESNGMLDRDSLQQRIDSGCYSEFYNHKGKYLFLVILATEKEQQILDFGEEETYSEIKRKVTWVNIDDLKKEDLCGRLHVSSFVMQIYSRE